MKAEQRLIDLIAALQDRPDTIEDYMERAMNIHQVRKGRRGHMFDVMRTFANMVVNNAGDYRSPGDNGKANG